MIEEHIGSVFEFIRNGASIKQDANASGYPITRIETIWNRGIDINRLGYADITKDKISDYSKYLLEVGDILMTHINSPAHLGKSAMYTGTPEVLIHGMNLLCLRCDIKKILPKFAEYFFNSNFFSLQLLKISNQSVNQASFSAGNLKKLQIPLPPLPVQQKIAAILDEADKLRQLNKQLIAKYDELTQSLFLDMFGDPVTNPKGWDEVELREVCKLQGGFSFKSKDFVKKGVPLVKIANVHFEDLVWDEQDNLPDNFLTKHSDFSLNEGDILMALTRPIIKSLGTVKAVTVKQRDLPALLNQRVARFTPELERLNKSYLLRTIYSDFFKNKIDKFSSTSLQPNVSNKQIEGIEIMLPPLKLQNQFAERVQAIEAQKAQAQKGLAKAEELFNSLLQRAFKGEIVS